jgi:hypothetical protein
MNPLGADRYFEQKPAVIRNAIGIGSAVALWILFTVGVEAFLPFWGDPVGAWDHLFERVSFESPAGYIAFLLLLFVYSPIRKLKKARIAEQRSQEGAK